MFDVAAQQQLSWQDCSFRLHFMQFDTFPHSKGSHAHLGFRKRSGDTSISLCIAGGSGNPPITMLTKNFEKNSISYFNMTQTYIGRLKTISAHAPVSNTHVSTKKSSKHRNYLYVIVAQKLTSVPAVSGKRSAINLASLYGHCTCVVDHLDMQTPRAAASGRHHSELNQ